MVGTQAWRAAILRGDTVKGDENLYLLAAVNNGRVAVPSALIVGPHIDDARQILDDRLEIASFDRRFLDLSEVYVVRVVGTVRLNTGGRSLDLEFLQFYLFEL